ncbi:UDP-3-O-(3-hydroxymyristoyl)glucosamine N-acyltransferase [Microvirga tunisiensis]|uniref:UDP-3-O-acylglucosamine N-acyltransferase n=2 Tax=Pannonibacter tanglangensis TaxID=2750084 RepID=A0A7X5J7X5_9HYPH|nr:MULTISPECIES: UDP-3-O-(3-hydroxymyristoyl)glucosamine N-acyltransferase [unclassified Pannonibacter]NBN62306.1 UDP-3-O-(3-hydroxymyristoyl)glucosamine N-acyltransferase [Pannonibacter sp. XCT-34]NBN77972.1 UDP-3-O-(3-hydroxymyristoyl)glucosamine N-acyltransferase [Pannonibacter sp. XCT-53]
MADPIFYAPMPALTLAELADVAGAELARGEPGLAISRVSPLEDAEAGALVFFDNTRYLDALATTRATACIVAPKHVAKVPETVALLVSKDPYRSWARVLARLYPEAMAPLAAYEAAAGISPRATVHPTARLEENVTVEPGAVIGAGVEIGSGTLVGPNAVISQNVRVGRDCRIGANVVLQHALLGNRVILHPGVAIGQDGFGYAMGLGGHLKVPQVGRVIIQDDVEIGANTTIDRGANRDTVVGEGTKIDNQVQVGHNVNIGRHCVIVSQVGLSGSSTLADYVAIGGQTGVAGHVEIGMGAQIAAVSVVNDAVPAGGRYGGTPAKPVKQWFRELTALKKLAERGSDT